MATARGEIDFWVVLQVMSYGTAAGLAVIFLLPWLRAGVPRRHGVLLTLAALLVLSCLFSGLWSPAVLSTMVLAALFGAGLLVAVQFSVEMASGRVPFFRALLWLRLLSLAVGLLIAVCYKLKLVYVSEMSTGGLRVRGGHVGVLGMCGTVGITVSLYRMLFITRRWVLFDMACLVLGVMAVYYARTRSLYVATGVTLVALGWFYLRDARNTQMMIARVAMGMFAVGAVGAVIMVLGGWLEAQWTRGSAESLSNLSSRTYIWAYTIEEVLKQPWGYGYTTGFRDLFMHMNWFKQLQFEDASGMDPTITGEAHNSHLEFLVGPGFIGFFIYCALMIMIGMRMLQAVRLAHTEDALHAARLSMALCIGFVADGMTTSAYALPLHQPFGYLVYVMAIGLAVESAGRTAWQHHRGPAQPLHPAATWDHAPGMAARSRRTAAEAVR